MTRPDTEKHWTRRELPRELHWQFVVAAMALYILGSTLGVTLFQSPNLSEAYLRVHGTEHRKYLEIKKSEWFMLHEERPLLHPPATEEQHEMAEFVTKYEATPWFQEERRRASHYVLYFRALNVLLLVALFGWFLRTPLLDFLDGRVAEVRRGLEEAADTRAETERLEAEAGRRIGAFMEVEERVRREAEDTLARDAERMERAFEARRAELERETEERLRAERHRAYAALRTGLVEEAAALAERACRAAADTDRLAAEVDEFTRLLEGAP